MRAGASGDITPKANEPTGAGVAWSQPKAGPAMSSPLVYQGYVYILEQNGGFINCYEAATGKPAYKRERIPNARAFWASPWAYDGKVFCLDDGGTTHVVQAGPTFKVLSKNTLSDQFWATPALAGGSLILPQDGEHLLHQAVIDCVSRCSALTSLQRRQGSTVPLWHCGWFIGVIHIRTRFGRGTYTSMKRP